MNPSFLQEESPPPRKRLPDRLRPVLRFGRPVLRFGRPLLRLALAVAKVLLWDPLTSRRLRGLRDEEGTPWERFCWGLLYRLTFLPVIAGLTVAALVYAGTHSGQNSNEVDPNSLGIYYDPVTLRSDDGVRLEAWVVPVFEAGNILRQKESALRTNHPAVLLVHDVGQDRQQMLPLVRPLHDAGFVVMAVALRGSGASAPSGTTFGLLESNDVRAAIAVLRKRNFVDPRRLAIVGVGAGANAAMLCAADDPSIQAMVLDHPAQLGGATLNSRVGPKHAALNWMRPMCKWAFELTYQVHLADLDITRFHRLISQRKVLMVDNESSVADFSAHASKNICRFLSASLLPEDGARADGGK